MVFPIMFYFSKKSSSKMGGGGSSRRRGIAEGVEMRSEEDHSDENASAA